MSGPTGHQWLEVMDWFAKAICDLPPDKYVKGLPNLPAELKREVRVCLIDDGVDVNHPGISDRLERHGKSFGASPGEKHRGLEPPYHGSTTGHGTLMAKMIARVCPYAKIVSYRLDTRRGEDDRTHFTEKSAADALEHAAKQDFDIISMSWTVKLVKSSDEDNSDDIRRLSAALRQAVKTKLVFCSSPDVGDISPDELASYYPVGSGVREIFRIGAATTDNNRWKQMGGKHMVDYILPGYEVREKGGFEVVQDDQSLNSGSSIATALGAGLAALLIHVVRMTAIRTYHQGKETSNEENLVKLASFHNIKSFATIRKVFDVMANKADRRDGGMYVDVWPIFKHRRADFKVADNSPDAEAEKWRIVTESARDIVSGGTWARHAVGW